MKWRLLTWVLVACLLSARLAMGAAAIVQSTIISYSTSADSRSLAYTSNVGAGSVFLVACSALLESGFSLTNPVLSDTLGNTWTVQVNVGVSDADSLADRLYIGTALSLSGGPNTVTCNPPGPNAFITIVIAEISGLDQGSPVDRVASCGGISCQNSGATVLSGTTSTTAQADELIIAAMTYLQTGGLTITENAPCILLQEFENWDISEPISVCSDIVSTTGTQARTWTLSGADAYKAAGIVTFRVASAAAAAAGGLVVVFP
jgi:hypothetical protein